MFGAMDQPVTAGKAGSLPTELSLALSSILIKVLVACLSHQIYPIIGRRTMIVTTHIVR